MKQVKKIKDIVIAEAVTEFYGEDIKAVDPKYHSSADRVGDLGDNPEPPKPVSLRRCRLSRPRAWSSTSLLLMA